MVVNVIGRVDSANNSDKSADSSDYEKRKERANFNFNNAALAVRK